MSKLYVFHHTNLDGMGVKILGIQFAKLMNTEYLTYSCNYGNVNDIVMDALKDVSPEDIYGIIIGDISVNEDVAEYLDKLKLVHQVNIILRDHHVTAEWLNKYSWAVVMETVQGISRCGTWLLLQALSEKFNNTTLLSELEVFVETVDDWDTWKWKECNNLQASDFNALFQILGEEDFTQYVLKLFHMFPGIDSVKDLFTPEAYAMIDAHNRQVRKTASSCEKHMTLVDLSVKNVVGKTCKLHTGVVFCNNDISDVADVILTEHAELDVLMLVSFPRSLSLRTQKDLELPLGDLAKMLTGSGGGHPKSAGATISHRKFNKILKKFLESSHDNRLSVNILEER